MNWQETLAHIEDPRFDAELNFASGTRSFFRGVGAEPVVQEALRLMNESGEVREAALDRIYDLAMAESDPEYQNPNDTALAVLLWLTYYTDEEWARVAADYVDRAPRCWYAHRLSQLIMHPAPTTSSDSWKHPGSESQISYRSSSPAESLNLVPTAVKFQITAPSRFRAEPSLGVETGRRVIQWAAVAGSDRADRVVWWSGTTDADGVANLNAEGWSPTPNSALEAGDRT